MPTLIALDVLSPIIHPARARRGDVLIVHPGKELTVVRAIGGAIAVVHRGPPMPHMLRELVRNGVIRARTPADGAALIAAAPDRRRVPRARPGPPPGAAE